MLPWFLHFGITVDGGFCNQSIGCFVLHPLGRLGVCVGGDVKCGVVILVVMDVLCGSWILF
jgi:hypothetical protein